MAGLGGADLTKADVTAIAAIIADAVAGVERSTLVDLACMMVDTPSPAGQEAVLARKLAAWGEEHMVHLQWRVQPLSATSANLIITSRGTGPEIALYSHLDSSLSGDPARDVLLTGREDPVGPAALEDGGRRLTGLGMGVAKAPAASAIVAATAVAAALTRGGINGRVSVLLAAGGTHRAPVPGSYDYGAPTQGMGIGVEQALRQGFRPRAVINTKAGARGVLYQEPGCVFLRVRVKGRPVPAPFRDIAAPNGGLPSIVGHVLEAIEIWRALHIARPTHGAEQLSREVAVGAIESGLPYKPDFLPGLLQVFVYIVALPGDNAGELASDLEASIRVTLGAKVDPTDVTVEVFGGQPAGVTDPSSDVVRLAQTVWDERFGPQTHHVTGWKGSTDGVIFRRAGIDTVRLGVAFDSDPSDTRREVIIVDELAAMATLYSELAVRWVVGATR